MAKKEESLEENEADWLEETIEFEETIEPVEQQPAAKEPVKHYQKLKWKGIRVTFKCVTCEVSLEQEDDMILHVLKHVPAEERDALMQELITEMEK